MKRLLPFVAAALGIAASAAHAGGPLSVCSGSAMRYNPPVVTLNYDGGGNLGARTKAQADAIVNSALAMWTNVPTATISMTRGADLPVDVTTANYATYYNRSGDGLNPVIYDTDGTIIDTLLGVGASGSVLGFAGSGGIGGATCRYVEGQAVINGKLNVSDVTLTNVLAHELGHFIGLDHTQLDSSQGLPTANYPLMYPIAFRNTPTLGDDDISAVTQLYPDTAASTTFGTLTGNFRLADGVTPVRGANIWVRENTTGKVYSSVSDYLGLNTGGFRMTLPPGTYTLRAEAIDAQFTGGSSVGPYSETSTDLSFQSPMYVGGAPIAPVVLGNAAPTTFTITAGCTATADFRINGAGSVTGCAAAAPAPAPASAVHLSNISTRGVVGNGNNVLIGGFIIGGTTSKTVVVTGVGPSLAAAGIANPLANPTLSLVRSADGVTLASNDDWNTAANAAQVQAAGFAPGNPRESAIMMTLPPGAYTTILSGVGGTTGTGIVAVYEVDHPEVPLTNISTRGLVGAGNDVMIGGFVISGTTPQTVVVTGTGPSLAAAGITNPLANPTLSLVRSSDGVVLASNDDWISAPNAAQIQAAGLAPGSGNESAIMVTLNPGAYTTILSGAGGGTGVGIVAVYAR